MSPLSLSLKTFYIYVLWKINIMKTNMINENKINDWRGQKHGFVIISGCYPKFSCYLIKWNSQRSKITITPLNPFPTRWTNLPINEFHVSNWYSPRKLILKPCIHIQLIYLDQFQNWIFVSCKFSYYLYIYGAGIGIRQWTIN